MLLKNKPKKTLPKKYTVLNASDVMFTRGKNLIKIENFPLSYHL